MDKELNGKLCSMVDNWFEEFICGKSGIGSPAYNPWLADLEVHTMDEDLNVEILEIIEEKHNVKLDMFDGYTPLITIALYCYIYGETK